MTDSSEAIREFLETTPLYTRWKAAEPAKSPLPIGQPEVLRIHCAKCEASTNWLAPHKAMKTAVPAPEWTRPAGSIVKNSQWTDGWGGDVIWRFHCAECEAEAIFWVAYRWERIRAGEDGAVVVTLRKIGQDPPQQAALSAALGRRLPKPAAEFLEKGNRCLQFGYGLGAIAYMRRVVEESVSGILTVVSDAAKLDGDSETVERIRTAADHPQASERLRIAADCLPPRLRPGGVNPLAILYGLTSGGLHTGSDSECVDLAQNIRETLEWLFVQVASETEQGRELAKRLNRLAQAKKG